MTPTVHINRPRYDSWLVHTKRRSAHQEWCGPDDPCHGDTLLGIANAPGF